MMTRPAPYLVAVALLALGTGSAAPLASAPAAHAHHLGVAAADLAPLPGACTGTCMVDASFLAYNPPLVSVADGSSVAWHSTDGGHNQRETSTPVGSPDACFSVASSVSANSAPVRFDIVGSTVTATVGSTTATCLNAVSAGGAAFLVPYHCTLHPNMNGFVLVAP
jgi:plastocyanin